jgi:hypothetical protein
MMKPKSHNEDPDMIGSVAALIRASKYAKQLAAETGTPYVIVRDGKLVQEIPELTEEMKRNPLRRDEHNIWHYHVSGSKMPMPTDGEQASTKPSSHLEDPDMVNSMAALIRASKWAKHLAAETGTDYVVFEDGKLVAETPKPHKSKKRKKRTSD